MVIKQNSKKYSIQKKGRKREKKKKWQKHQKTKIKMVALSTTTSIIMLNINDP